MSLTQWLLLCFAFTLYLLFGGTIFMIFEQDHEAREAVKLTTLRQDIQEILFRLDNSFYDNKTSEESLRLVRKAKESILNRVSLICGGANLLDDTGTQTPHWDLYNSVFYGFTIVTTIGYGNMTPKTDWSRCVAIIFGLFGIPLNGILLSTLGEYFSRKLIKAHHESKDDKFSMLIRLSMYLLPGTIIFIVIPSFIFTQVEKWTMIESLYFSCITLMTIGFGDFVPGQQVGNDPWLLVYKILILVWIQFGLGYLFMILSFITKGFRNKKLRTAMKARLHIINNTKQQLLTDLEDMRHALELTYTHKLDLDSQNQGKRYLDKFLTYSQLTNFQKRLTDSENEVGRTRRRKTVSNINQNIEEFDHKSPFLLAVSRVVQDVIEAVDEIHHFENYEASPLEPVYVNTSIASSSSKSPQVDEEYQDTLKKVVVQKDEKLQSNNFLQKVSTAIRKISTGSQGRKISHNQNQIMLSDLKRQETSKSSSNQKLIERTRKITVDGSINRTVYSPILPKKIFRSNSSPGFRNTDTGIDSLEALDQIIAELRQSQSQTINQNSRGETDKKISGGNSWKKDSKMTHQKGNQTRQRKVGVSYQNWPIPED